MKKTQKIDNPDILLLLLFSPGKTNNDNEPIVGRTRLVKMLFLFKKELLRHFRKGTAITSENFYEFFPWDFGPFSKQIYDDITFFILRDFINSSLVDEERIIESMEEIKSWRDQWESDEDEYENPDDYFEEEFSLTDKGILFSEGLYNTLLEPQKTLIHEFKKKTSNAPLRAILKYTYEKYPEMTKKSKIKDDVIGSC